MRNSVLKYNSDAITQLQDLRIKLESDVQKLEASWIPMDTAAFQHSGCKEVSGHQSVSDERAAFERLMKERSSSWKSIEDWVDQVKDAIAGVGFEEF